MKSMTWTRLRLAFFALPLLLAGFIQTPAPQADPSRLELNSLVSSTGFSVEVLGTLGGTYSVAHDINEAKQVVGYSSTSSGES